MTKTQNKHDSYSRVEARLLNTSTKAIRIAQVNGTKEGWIPRTLLSLACENRVDNAALGSTVLIEARTWKLEEMGFD